MMRAWLNRWRRRVVHALLHRTVFGEHSGGRALPNTRIAPSTCIEHPEALQLADHVYIGPFCFIEASGGVCIGEGVQITHHVSIVTHSSHRAQRLLGSAYAGWTGPGVRPGWVAGPVQIGAYSFIGPHSLLEAGTTLGEGCIVRAGSVLRGGYPAHAVIAGNPARVVGDARDGDRRWLDGQPALATTYDAWVGEGAAAGLGAGRTAAAEPMPSADRSGGQP